MRCERVQRLIGDALASGEVALRGEVAAHVRACGDCEKFYEAQRNLFAAIDAGVREIVDVPVPAGLGRSVPAESETKGEGFAGKLSWGFVAPGLVAVFIVAAVLGLHGWRRAPERAEPVATNRSAMGSVADVTTTPVEQAKAVERTAKKKKEKPIAVAPEKKADWMEVIVPADEREGYEKYVESAQVGVSLPPKPRVPLEPIEIAPTEIALLKFKDLTVGSLSEETNE